MILATEFSFLGSSYPLYLSSLSDAAQLYLDKVLDWDQGGVDTHLNEIAYAMIDWETKLSSLLKLTDVQIHDLKAENSNPVLLRYRYKLKLVG